MMGFRAWFLEIHMILFDEKMSLMSGSNKCCVMDPWHVVRNIQ